MLWLAHIWGLALTMESVKILNISIDNISQAILLSQLTQNGGIVFTPNVDHLMKLWQNPELLEIYNKADFHICDSRILQYAACFLGTPIDEKISGSDLFPAFYMHNRDNENIKIFLLGGVENVAEIAQKRINKKVGRDIIVGTYSPPFGFENDEFECQQILDTLLASDANVIAVGLGAPKQEKWIAKYHNQLSSQYKIFLAIGATINFEAGTLKRAPQWMSRIGIEWLYRLAREPKRLWKRYLLEGVPFFWLILLQRLGHLPTVKNSSLESKKVNTQKNKDSAFKFKIILQFLIHSTTITLVFLWLTRDPAQFPKISDSWE